MILSDLSIRRPVLATVVNLIIVLVGLIAWERLTIREFPFRVVRFFHVCGDPSHGNPAV